MFPNLEGEREALYKLCFHLCIRRPRPGGTRPVTPVTMRLKRDANVWEREGLSTLCSGMAEIQKVWSAASTVQVQVQEVLIRSLHANFRHIPWPLCLSSLWPNSTFEVTGRSFRKSFCFELLGLINLTLHSGPQQIPLSFINQDVLIKDLPHSFYFHLPFWFLPLHQLFNKKSPLLSPPSVCPQLCPRLLNAYWVLNWLCVNHQGPNDEHEMSISWVWRRIKRPRRKSGSGTFGIHLCVWGRALLPLPCLDNMGEGYQNDVIAQKINYEVKYLCMIIKMILLHHDVCISQLGLP